VSHQIKALEHDLKTQLFHRKTREISLTTEGRQLAHQIGRALDVIEDAAFAVRAGDPEGVLKITVAPFFGNRWLLPRLSRFHAKYPAIQIEPVLSFDYVDLEATEFDAAVRYGAGNWAGLQSTQIFRDEIRPVCAPQLVEGRTLPLSASDIFRLPLASSKRWQEDWASWASAAGTQVPADATPIEYESRAFMFDAALSGKAVILVDFRMTAADEAAGSLVNLNALSVERPQGIHLVSNNRRNPDPKVALLAQWMKQESSCP